ncbi:MAG: hypothetical protein ABII68_01665 [Pseudomonadota bacterium]
MSDWFEDPWIKFALNMGEDFFRYHNENLPEEAEHVWNENEFVYFCYAFTLYAARLKFERKMGKAFSDREAQYKENIKKEMDYTAQNPIEGLDLEKANYSVYKKREQEYLSLLFKGSGSILSTISMSPFKKACKPFVSYSCKRYIFPGKELIKIVHSWLVEKGIDFEKRIDFI